MRQLELALPRDCAPPNPTPRKSDAAVVIVRYRHHRCYWQWDAGPKPAIAPPLKPGPLQRAAHTRRLCALAPKLAPADTLRRPANTPQHPAVPRRMEPTGLSHNDTIVPDPPWWPSQVLLWQKRRWPRAAALRNRVRRRESDRPCPTAVLLLHHYRCLSAERPALRQRYRHHFCCWPVPVCQQRLHGAARLPCWQKAQPHQIARDD